MGNRRGFTIIELLISIGIIAVVVSLSVVGLSRAKKSASMTKDLSLIRQNASATLMYTTDFKETFPIVGDSSFDVVYWWYECLLASGHVASRQAVDPNYKEPPLHDRSRFEFTRTTSTAQRYLTYEGADSRPPYHLEAQRVASVAFPSQKGMIVRGWTGDFPYFTPSAQWSQLNLDHFHLTPSAVRRVFGSGAIASARVAFFAACGACRTGVWHGRAVSTSCSRQSFSRR